MTDQREKQKRGRSGEGADGGRGAADRHQHREAAGAAREGGAGLKMP
jgi:hypothetical protein